MSEDPTQDAADKFWAAAAPHLRRAKGQAPLTAAEAEEEYRKIVAVDVSQAEIDQIIKRCTGLFPVKYSCTLSPALRTIITVTDPKHAENFQVQIEHVVSRFDTDPVTLAEVKVPDPLGVKVMRQIDLWSEPDRQGTLMWKCFVWWNQDEQEWHVWAEVGSEDWWETHLGAMERNYDWPPK